MKNEYSPTLMHWKGLGIAAFCLTFAIGCSTTQPSLSSEGPLEEIQEVEAGNDPEVAVADSGAPQDCVENDARPACHVKPRGLGFIPIKVKSETSQRCLRPSGGSTNENVEIILSTCSNTNSRRWYREQGVYAGGDKIINMHSGKCIERVGAYLRQRTCANSSNPTSAHNQTWVFQGTPPFGSGDFLKSWTSEGGCARAMNSTSVRMSTCQNDANRRWYQAAF
ncbi:MAG: RICIN domain-containing protein [Nitrospirota bacterium]|nr:RICIN domain-containing protein [Nitrospirota bacterium]